ncbi:hypothetical protein DFH27DRAFT_486093 [Peziza echinospora]|nr:hypothetical protein DFH27DRAFT_486093 [Peziza echinospora]
MIKVTSIFTCLLLATSNVALAQTGVKVTATPADAMAVYKFVKDTGLKIEGASVSKNGDIWATDGSNILNLKNGTIGLKGPGSPAENSLSQLASSRWLSDGRLIAGDAIAHKVYVAQKFYASNAFVTLFESKDFLQPNDIAVGSCEKVVYFSGMNYTANSTAGETGEVAWLDLRQPAASMKLNKVPKDVLAKAGIYRTNGIEVVTDPKTGRDSLYVTSAQNVNFATTGTKLFRFDIDPRTGALGSPVEALDIKARLTKAGIPVNPDMDPDGMRSDLFGNIYMTLNAAQQVLRWNPTSGDIVHVNLTTVQFPTNLEFGGANGNELVVVGKCVGNKLPCVDTIAFSDKPVGRAWAMLNGKVKGAVKLPRGNSGRLYA